MFIIFTLFILLSALKPSDTIHSYVQSVGFEVEDHFATTEDGYILHLFRIPNPGKPVVYLQHGILASAWDWLVNVPENSPGFAFAMRGYDVWLGNSRGNTFSRNHTTLSPHSGDFWNFSYTDMARHDLPTQLNYIIDHSGQQNLTYVGWSQGTTQLFIADINNWIDQSKINLGILVSPVSYLTHCGSLLMKTLAEAHIGDILWHTFGNFGFLDGSKIMSEAEQLICKLSAGVVCEITLDVICGTSKYDEKNALTNMTAHFPAGTSSKDINHFAEWMQHGKFDDFDYGSKRKNQKIYGQDSPPVWDLGKLSVPLALFAGTHDTFVNLVDLARFRKEANSTNAIHYYREFDQFSHVTWLVGEPNVWNVWFDDVDALMKLFNPIS